MMFNKSLFQFVLTYYICNSKKSHKSAVMMKETSGKKEKFFGTLKMCRKNIVV